MAPQFRVDQTPTVAPSTAANGRHGRRGRRVWPARRRAHEYCSPSIIHKAHVARWHRRLPIVPCRQVGIHAHMMVDSKLPEGGGASDVGAKHTFRADHYCARIQLLYKYSRLRHIALVFVVVVWKLFERYGHQTTNAHTHLTRNGRCVVFAHQHTTVCRL
jgi:hypothetical protein